MSTNDELIAFYESRKGGRLRRYVRALTRWAWKPVMGSVITWAFSDRGLITSNTFHEMMAFQDKVLRVKKLTAQSQAKEGGQ